MVCWSEFCPSSMEQGNICPDFQVWWALIPMGLYNLHTELNERLAWCGYGNEQLSKASEYNISKPEHFLRAVIGRILGFAPRQKASAFGRPITDCCAPESNQAAWKIWEDSLERNVLNTYIMSTASTAICIASNTCLCLENCGQTGMEHNSKTLQNNPLAKCFLFWYSMYMCRADLQCWNVGLTCITYLKLFSCSWTFTRSSGKNVSAGWIFSSQFDATNSQMASRSTFFTSICSEPPCWPLQILDLPSNKILNFVPFRTMVGILFFCFTSEENYCWLIFFERHSSVSMIVLSLRAERKCPVYIIWGLDSKRLISCISLQCSFTLQTSCTFLRFL